MTDEKDDHRHAEGRWGKIPAWWLDHPDLDADGFAVLAALATFADENGVCWPSQSTLAAKLKRSRPTINRILQGLSDSGLVGIEHRRGRDGSRLSCLYRLRLVHNGAPQPAASARPVAGTDRDDSRTNGPCPTASQEQLHSEQNPDPHTGREADPPQSVPSTWMPNADDLEWARHRFEPADLARHVESFVLRCKAHGYRYRDIGAAWRAWLIEDAAKGRVPSSRKDTMRPDKPTATARTGEQTSEQRTNAWMTVAARFQGKGHATHHVRP